MSFKNYITEIPNFPIEGVNFKDLSPLIGDSKMFSEAIKQMGDLVIWESRVFHQNTYGTAMLFELIAQ